MTTEEFLYFDLPEPETVWRYLGWAFVTVLAVSIMYLAVTA